MEMGRRDLRRGGANGFSKNQSGSKFSAKPKKGMLKKLGCDFTDSDLENDVSKKKSKLPKKNLKNTNGVDHTSVPRKLRSAMKKRNLESVNKIVKRLSRSKTEFCKKDLIKENQEMIVSDTMMISKDEKEVVETLNSLAEMFTEADSIDKKTCDDHEKETSKIDSILVLEPLEPVVSVKQIDEKPLENTQHSLMEPARAIETKVTSSSGTDHKSNGLALWPGLYSTKLPPWMDSAASPPFKNASPLRTHPKKLKKCASHIYISRLIKVLQIEQRSSEISQTGVPEPVTTMFSPSKKYQNLQLFGLDKTHNSKPVQEDITQPALELFGPHTSSQSYDFLSLSFPGSAQSSSPSPNSFPQYPTSAAYTSHSPATSSYQVQQISPYLASQYQTAYNANKEQQQQLQKRIWAAQYRPPTTPPFYSKPNLTLNLTNSQPLHVASSPRYNNSLSQQQQRLMAANAARSMSQHHNYNPSRTVMNRQERNFPLIYDDSRTPLQLLCREKL